MKIKKIQININLMTRYFILFFVVVLLPYWIAGSIVLSGARKEVDTYVEDRHKLLTSRLARIVEHEFLDCWAEGVRSFRADRGLSNFSQPDRERISTFHVQSIDDLLAFSITDPDNSPIFSWIAPDITIKQHTRDYAGAMSVLLNLDETIREDLLALGKSDVLIDFLMPSTLFMEPRLKLLAIPAGGSFRMQDRDIGAITEIISLDRLAGELHKLSGSMNLDILILDDTGKLLLHSNPNLNYLFPKPRYENVPSVRDFLRPVSRKRRGEMRKGVHVVTRVGGDDLSMEGLKWIGTDYDIGPWLLWTRLKGEPPLDDFMKGRGRLIYQWSLLGVLLAGVGGAIFMAGVTRPLKTLLEVGRRLAAEDFSGRIDIERKDEFGELGGIMNEIGETLQKNRDMTQNRLVKEKHRTEAIVKSMADGLLVIDGDSNIVMMNSTFEEWFGLFEMNAVGKPYSSILKNANLVRHIKEVETSGRRGAYSAEVTIVLPRTRMTRSLQVRSVLTTDYHDKRAGVVLVLRDISTEKKIDEMKSDLVSTVSHELRTPITSIQGFSEILLDEKLENEERKEFLGIIHIEATRLGALIADFLDLSRIESGEITMNMKSVNLREIIDASMAVVEGLAEEINVTLHLDFPDQAVYMIGDRDKLEQVCINQLSNGIKYGRENSDLFTRVQVDDTTITLSVKDLGHGIPEETLPYIFNKFYRVDMSSTAKMRGTGLGLAIVREIIEKHKGSVEVESKIGSGSIFTVKLPRFGT